MKLIKITILTGFVFLLFGCKSSSGDEMWEHSHEIDGHAHSHTHYPEYDSIRSHKLIFPSKVPDRIITNLSEDPAHSIAVNWRTNQQIDSGFIQIAKATDGPEFRAGTLDKLKAKTASIANQNIKYNEPLVKANYHSVLVKDLDPATTYLYRVGDGGSDDSLWSEWFQIRTASSNPDDPFSFIYFGDAQNEVKSMWSMVIRGSFKMFPDVNFMLHAGDLINDRDSNLEWGEWFYAGSFIHATIPSIMTPGNHEYRKEKLSVLWQPQFNLPKNGPLPEIDETTYYVDYQGLRIISIDAVSFEDKKKSRKAQIDWLEHVLEQNPKKWTVIFMHYPVLSVAAKREDDNSTLKKTLKPIIDKYKVDLVLQGHDHTYARGEVKNLTTGISDIDESTGTVYAVSVSGPKMYDSEKKDWMERRGEYTQLFQIISIAKNTLKYESYTPIGTIYDAFDIIKDENGHKKLINHIPETPERLKSDLIQDK